MSFKTAVDITQHWNKELNIIVRYYQNKNVNVNYQLRGLMASQPGLWASQPGLRASQPDLRTSQPDLRASQPGLRASKPSLRASQPGWGGRMDGRKDGRTNRLTENFPILQDFVSYRAPRFAEHISYGPQILATSLL